MAADSLDIIIPVKALDEGKSRLSAVLAPKVRQQLCRDLFRATLEMAQAVPGAHPLVVSRDAEVLETAQRAGANWLRESGHGGLNAALVQAQAQLAQSARPCLILPCDLILATCARLSSWLDRRQVSTLVPDLAGGGTNLLWFAPCLLQRFCFAYGEGSHMAHIREAERANIPLRVERLDWAGQDLDLPEDLTLEPLLSARSQPAPSRSSKVLAATRH